MVGLAIGILNGGVHAREDAQLVQPPLVSVIAVGESGSPGFSVMLRLISCVLVIRLPRDQHLAHELLPALVDHVLEVDAVRLRGRLGVPFESRDRESRFRNTAPGWRRGPPPR